jgi:tetratricopeptide (TPR) repeat protein
MTDQAIRRNTTSPLRLFVASGLLFAASVAVFAGAANGQFLSWDDEYYLTQNVRIQNPSLENIGWFFSHPYFNSYTPVAFLSHALDWYLWGSDPRPHHWHNILLHALNTVGLFWCALFVLGPRRTGSPRTMADRSEGPLSQKSVIAGAAAAALLFAVHPLRVESVAWVSDRKDLLAVFFSLSTVLTYFRGTFREAPPSWTWLTASTLLFALGILSKFLVVFLPLVLLLVESAILYPGRWRKMLRQLILWKAPYLIPAVVVGLTAVGAVGVDPLGLRVQDISIAERLALPMAIPWFYVRKLFIPANLSPVYQVAVSASTWLAAIPVIGITALAIYFARKKRSGLLTAWMAYLILLAPTFLFLSPFLQHTADRHSYIATIPLFLLAGGGIAHLWKRTGDEKLGRVLRLTISALVLIISSWYSLLTIRQIRVWENSVSLWVQAVTVSPDLAIGYLNLGNAVAAAGNTDDAIRLYQRALALERGYGPAWSNMGVCFQMQGKPVQAEESFRSSIAFSPDYYEAYLNLGEIMQTKGEHTDAARLYREAAWRNPRSEKPWIHLGDLYREEGKIDSSLASYQVALGLNPYSGASHWGMARSLEAGGRAEEAKRHSSEAARLGFRKEGK